MINFLSVREENKPAVDPNNWVIWVIFGLLILLLVGFLVYSYLNERKKNRRLAQKRLELKRATVKTSKELAIRIYHLIEFNQEQVNSIVPGQSTIKMKEINFFARQFLKKIYDSKAFKTIYIDPEDADPVYAANIKVLIDKKSNLWTKYCSEQIDYFKRLHDELLNDENFSLLKNEAINDIQKFFNEVVKNYESTE